VFGVEPLPADSALWALPNVLLSPHCADRTSTFQQDAMRQFGANVARYGAGQPLLNIVDKARLACCACACAMRCAMRLCDATHRACVVR
jgi:phosphoglycerate dehydrogenase-like enzyme